MIFPLAQIITFSYRLPLMKHAFQAKVSQSPIGGHDKLNPHWLRYQLALMGVSLTEWARRHGYANHTPVSLAISGKRKTKKSLAILKLLTEEIGRAA